MSRGMNKPLKMRGKGCLFLFALPFLAVGILSIARALRSILSGNYEIPELIILMVFGIIFGGVGVGILLGARYGGRIMKREILLRERHPDEPWKWREEWTTNRIKGAGKGALAFTWFFALFWNLISWTVIGSNFKDLLARKDWTTLFVLLFPLIGLGLLIWAVKATIRWRKYGSSTLVLNRVPVPVGGILSGIVETGIKDLPEGGVTLTVNCIRKVQSSGKRSSSSESILWQEEKRVGRELLFRSLGGFGIPVEFQIPEECLETSLPAGNVHIFWRLHANAAVSGVDFDTSFIVPVFKTGERIEEAIPETYTEPFPPEDEEAYGPRSETVRVRPSPTGGTEFYFGPLRNPRIALGLAVFLAVWAVPIWMLLRRGASHIFSLIFITMFALMAFFLVRLVVGTTRVVADGGGIRVHRGFLGLTLLTTRVPRAEIEDVHLRIGMQKNPGSGSAGRAYYSIDVIRRDGSKVVAGRHLRDKKEASFIASEIKRMIGIR